MLDLMFFAFYCYDTEMFIVLTGIYNAENSKVITLVKTGSKLIYATTAAATSYTTDNRE